MGTGLYKFASPVSLLCNNFAMNCSIQCLFLDFGTTSELLTHLLFHLSSKHKDTDGLEFDNFSFQFIFLTYISILFQFITPSKKKVKASTVGSSLAEVFTGP